MDPLTSLGLNSDSIVSYRMGEVERSHVSELPELLPCGYLVGENNLINITLKGETLCLYGIYYLVLSTPKCSTELLYTVLLVPKKY